MTVNDIYVIDPEYYEMYQKGKRQAYRVELLSGIIKFLLFIFFVVISFFAYKTVEKNGYLHKLLAKKASSEPQHETTSSYIEVPARREVLKPVEDTVEDAKESFSHESLSQKPSVEKDSKKINIIEPKGLSDEYLKRIEEELRQTP